MIPADGLRSTRCGRLPSAGRRRSERLPQSAIARPAAASRLRFHRRPAAVNSARPTIAARSGALSSHQRADRRGWRRLRAAGGSAFAAAGASAFAASGGVAGADAGVSGPSRRLFQLQACPPLPPWQLPPAPPLPARAIPAACARPSPSARRCAGAAPASRLRSRSLAPAAPFPGPLRWLPSR